MNIIQIAKSETTRKSVVIAWSLAVFVAVSVPFITGNINGQREAIMLLEAIQKSSLIYGSSVAGSCATVLALMLTLLSIIKWHYKEPNVELFTRFHAIGAFCVYGLIGGLILMLFVSFPLEAFDNIPDQYISYLYYLICMWNGLLAGCIISVVLILREAATQIIADLTPAFNEDGYKTSEAKNS